MTHRTKLKLIALLTAFFAFYSYIWFYAANVIEEKLLAEVAYLRSDYLTIEHGPISIKGYPFHIDIEIQGLYVTGKNRDDYALSIEGSLHGTGSLFNPSRIILFTDATAKLVDPKKQSETQSGPVLLSADQTQILFDFGSHAASPDARSAKQIQVFLTNITSSLSDTEIYRLSFRIDRDESDPFLTDYSVDFEDIDFKDRLIPSLPSRIEHVHVDVSAKGKMMTELPLDEFILKWYETEGMLDVSKVIVEWGSIKIVGNGTISLDESLQPIASFGTEFNGLQETLDIMTNQNLINSLVKNLVLLQLEPFKETRLRADGNGQEIYHKISLSVQSNGEDNDFIIGSIPIFRFPHINWKRLSLNPSGTQPSTKVK